MKNREYLLPLIKQLSILIFYISISFIMSCDNNTEQTIQSKNVIYTLGANSYGPLGTGNEQDYDVPLEIPGLRNIISIEAAGSVSMALASNGKVFMWGYNGDGQLGIGDTNSYIPYPREVNGLPEIKKIKTGGRISLALDINGEVWFWGTIYGDDFKEVVLYSSSFPEKVTGLINIVDIDCGLHHCIALDKNGSVWTWGRNVDGVLGDGTSNPNLIPHKVNGIENAIKVTAGSYHNLVLMNNGELIAWGNNLHGETGINSYNNEVHVPSKVHTVTHIIDIAAGANHNLCLTSDSTLWTWGENFSGQLGIGEEYNDMYTPVKVSYLSKVKLIYAAGSCSIALTSDGHFWSWGTYYFRSMEGGYSGYDKTVPTLIDCLSNASLIACGGFHYLIVKENEDLMTTGSCFEQYVY